VKPRYSTAKEMYEAMSRHYARVYDKGMSPYGTNWKLEQHRHEFGDDKSLIEMFQNVKNAEAYHRKRTISSVANLKALIVVLDNYEIDRSLDDDAVYL
jgi:hypothetical protein